jgi:hypothetical protein
MASRSTFAERDCQFGSNQATPRSGVYRKLFVFNMLGISFATGTPIAYQQRQEADKPAMNGLSNGRGFQRWMRLVLSIVARELMRSDRR